MWEGRNDRQASKRHWTKHKNKNCKLLRADNFIFERIATFRSSPLKSPGLFNDCDVTGKSTIYRWFSQENSILTLRIFNCHGFPIAIDISPLYDDLNKQWPISQMADGLSHYPSDPHVIPFLKIYQFMLIWQLVSWYHELLPWLISP
jgi:hypothetical protein